MAHLPDPAAYPIVYPDDWSPSGKWIMLRPVSGAPPNVGFDLWIAPASGQQPPFLYLKGPGKGSARFSPDEKWIAYVSSESGRFEVYVRPFSGGPAGPTGKIQVSSNGGEFPVWQRDGKELFFIGYDLKLYSVKTAEFETSRAAPQPAPLFTPCGDAGPASLPGRGLFYMYTYDVSPDGQRFLFDCKTLGPGRYDVMLNWWKTAN